MPKNQNYVKGMLNNNLKSEGREMIDWIFYDSLTHTASVRQELVFFQNTIGTVGRIRTNMKSAGQLPNPQSFAVIELGFRVLNPIGTSLHMAGGAAPVVHPVNAIMNQATIDFKLEPSTDYETHGLEVWEQVDYMNDTNATLGVDTASYCHAGFKPIRFKAPILIPSSRAFSVSLSFTAPADAGGLVAGTTKIYCYIKGLLRRNA